MNEWVVTCGYAGAAAGALFFGLELLEKGGRPWPAVVILAWSALAGWDSYCWFLVARASGDGVLEPTALRCIDAACILLACYFSIAARESTDPRDRHAVRCRRALVAFCWLVTAFWVLAMLFAGPAFWSALQSAWQVEPPNQWLWGTLAALLFAGLGTIVAWRRNEPTVWRDIYLALIAVTALYAGYAPFGHLYWPYLYPRWPFLLVLAIGAVGWAYANRTQRLLRSAGHGVGLPAPTTPSNAPKAGSLLRPAPIHPAEPRPAIGAKD